MKSPSLPPSRATEMLIYNRETDPLRHGSAPSVLINIWSAEQTGPDAYWSPLLLHGYNIDQRLQATADTFSILEVTVSQKISSELWKIRCCLTLHIDHDITVPQSPIPQPVKMIMAQRHNTIVKGHKTMGWGEDSGIKWWLQLFDIQCIKLINVPQNKC